MKERATITDARALEPLDCTSPEGIAVGLLDALMTVARVVQDQLHIHYRGPSPADEFTAVHDGTSVHVYEALKDLRTCQPLKELMGVDGQESYPLHTCEQMQLLLERVELLRMPHRTVTQETRLCELDVFMNELEVLPPTVQAVHELHIQSLYRINGWLGQIRDLKAEVANLKEALAAVPVKSVL